MGAPEGQTIRFAGDAGFYTDDIVVYFSKYCILQFSYIFGMHAWLLFWNISIYLFIYLIRLVHITVLAGNPQQRLPITAGPNK
jgi:hypothetical protein